MQLNNHHDGGFRSAEIFFVLAARLKNGTKPKSGVGVN